VILVVFGHNLIPDPNQTNRKGSGQHLLVQLKLLMITFSNLPISFVNNHEAVGHDVVQLELGAKPMVDFIFSLLSIHLLVSNVFAASDQSIVNS
jgi:hypothetical protein